MTVFLIIFSVIASLIGIGAIAFVVTDIVLEKKSNKKRNK